MKPRNATRPATRSRTRSCSPSRRVAAAKLSRLRGFLTALLSFTDSFAGRTPSTDIADGWDENISTSTMVILVIDILMGTIASLGPGFKYVLIAGYRGRSQMTDGGRLEWRYVPGGKREAS